MTIEKRIDGLDLDRRMNASIFFLAFDKYTNVTTSFFLLNRFEMREPIFNIIYIPNTVAYQSVALVSLLLNSRYSFRLVGNALGQEEAKLLKAIAQSSDRLDFINFESDFIIPHGTLLDLLFHSEDSDFFCFCDSDIFLFEKLFCSVQELIQSNHIFSSAGRIENDDEAVYSGFKGGATTMSPDLKIPLATSFFCVYQRQAIQEISRQYGVGFEQYRNFNQVPSAAKKQLKKLEIEFSMFDTGKLMSVLMYCHGKKNMYHDIKGLLHIGGMSGRYLQQINLSQQQTISDIPKHKDSNERSKVKQRSEHEITLKKLYGKYFYIYLHHLIGKGEKPELTVSDESIKLTITEIENKIESMLKNATKDSELSALCELLTRADT